MSRKSWEASWMSWARSYSSGVTGGPHHVELEDKGRPGGGDPYSEVVTWFVA
jgi:hypothetical protein